MVFAKSSSTGVGTGPKSSASSEPWNTGCKVQLNHEHRGRKTNDLPPMTGSLVGMNSVKKYAKNGCEDRGAALLKNSLRGDRYILSVYHDSARSNRESPVWNGPPAVGSLAGYSVSISPRTSDVSVVLSRMSWPMKKLNAWSSVMPGWVILMRDLLKTVPSFNCKKKS